MIDSTTANGLLFDPARAAGGGTRDLVRSFRTAAALGWKMEANWTDPLLFFIYSVAKPLASALILVFMIQVIAGPAGIALRPFVIVGSALWSFVASGVAGLAWAVLDDRERYRMLKYVYVSPSSFLVVLVGRGVARLAVGAMGAGITLSFGVLLLGVPFQPAEVSWLMLVIVLALGAVAINALGLMMAAVCLQTRQESWDYPEVVVGALWSFVVSGVAGLAWAVLDDRERYRMLKYVYVSPSSFLVVLVGRGVARLAVGAMGAGITLSFGVLLLGVPFQPAEVSWLMLVIVLALGAIAINALGLIMAAVCLQTRQESWDYPEVVVGALFLVVGAVFPLAELPLPLQFFGLISPLTWWIAGIRQALFPGGPSSIGGPGSLWLQLSGEANPTDLQIVFFLLLTGAVVTLGAAILFRVGEARARDRGLIDRTTGS